MARGGRGTFSRSLSQSELGHKPECSRGSCRPESVALQGLGGGLQPAAPEVRGALQAFECCLLSLLQVNLVLGDGRSLGLTIRGGAEYGLGIYITGVDPGSEAESGGLKVRCSRLPWQEMRCRAACLGGRGNHLYVVLFAVRLPAEQSAPTLGTGPSWEPSPGYMPLIHSSEQATGGVPPSPTPQILLAVLSIGWPPTWCWAVGQPELFVGAVLQTLLMDCDGPDSGFIMVHGEGRGEKAASRLGLHWGSFKAGIPSRATSNHWPNMSNSHFKED